MSKRVLTGLIVGTLFCSGAMDRLIPIAPFSISGFSAACYAYDKPPNYDGRALEQWEKDVIADAIDSIWTPPPDSISYIDAQGNAKRVSCFAIGSVLWSQLWSGRLEAETKAKESSVNHLTDGVSTSGDQANIDPVILNAAATNPTLYGPWLQETLVHEGIHKWQTVAGANRDELEIEALSAAMAYKLASGVAQSSTLYSWEDSLRKRHQRNYLNWQDQWRIMQSVNEDTIVTASPFYEWYIDNSPPAPGGDCFTSFRPDTSDTSTFHPWSFGPMRAADFTIFSDHYLLPPGHDLAVICGSEPVLGLGRVQALDIFQGQVLGIFLTRDFGPPQFPPMSFYSMTHVPGTWWWYMMDTLNQQIEVFRDSNLDSIPDEFIRVFANAAWPPFASLWNMRGIEVAIHPTWGEGIVAYERDMRDVDVIDPYDSCLFLMDFTGDFQADWCEMVSNFELISFKPCIMDEAPWAGDANVPLFATWNHTIQVWTSDSLGEVLGEALGAVFMGSRVHEECALLRALIAGEYIIAVDQIDGSRLSLATRVIDPTPQGLTMYVTPSGELCLRWESVSGASHYKIYASEDAVNYGDTGLTTVASQMVLPLYADNRHFFSVTAEK